MKTDEAIQREIKALKKLVPVGPFKHDTAESLRWAIEELEHGVDMTCDEWDELGDSQKEIVCLVKDWKDDLTKDRPSEGWGRLVK
jgi:hypothetical protein